MKIRRKVLFLLTLLLVINVSPLSAKHKFTVVIDAGHGGHDSGALGKKSKEKDINLAVALLVGKKIERNNKDVKVVYTRKKDVFVTLKGRADIANRNNADLFISIHSNSASPRAYGTETYILGLHKTKSNLRVAMRENSVILLEDNHQKRYQNFNPRSVDSYIMFDFMQDKYLENSMFLASAVQKEFQRKRRHNRGVRQAGFMVLHRSACASVLIELGFVTNKKEERFMKSRKGQEQLASAIYKAFISYKKRYQKKTSTTLEATKTAKKTSTTKSKKQKTEKKQPNVNNGVVYKIQLVSLKRKISTKSKVFKGLSNIHYYKENGFYKYTYGKTNSYNKIKSLRKNIQQKFPQAMIIAFQNKKKISIRKALKLSK